MQSIARSYPLLWNATVVMGCLGVGLAAYGSHGLPKRVKDDPKALRAWDAATKQQFIHTCASMAALMVGKPVSSALFLGGMTLFCGTVYLIQVKGASVRQRIGRLAPLGGYLLMVGWLSLIVLP